MNKNIIIALISGGLIAMLSLQTNAQMAKSGLQNKGKTWDRDVDAAIKRKRELSKGANEVHPVGNIIDGTLAGPNKVQKEIKVDAPPEHLIKQVGTIAGTVKAKGGLIEGDTDGPNALTDEEIKMLTSNDDIVLCGKSGEIVGTKEWGASGKICNRTHFKIGSPRDRLILLAERAGNNKNDPFYLTPQELKFLKSKKDVQLSGKTGEIIGLKGWNKRDKDTCKYGFNKKSPRYKILLHFAKNIL